MTVPLGRFYHRVLHLASRLRSLADCFYLCLRRNRFNDQLTRHIGTSYVASDDAMHMRSTNGTFVNGVVHSACCTVKRIYDGAGNRTLAQRTWPVLV